jgi:leader peptidase (prepilin peptidase)/N-methyltransferase
MDVSPFQSLTSLGPGPLMALTALFGLLVGSFLNVVIHRVPRMMEAEWQAQAAELRGEPLPESPPYNLINPRSSCPQCGTPIAARHNIPVLSWLLLKGRCAHCSAAISVRYPLVELLTAGLAAAAVARYGATAAGVGALIVVFFLVALTFIDLDTQLLPDDLTLPLLWLGLAFNLWGVFVPLQEAVVGAMLGYGILWSIYWIFKLVTKKEGMGYGDFKLLAALGAWFGWQALPSIILLSAGVGAAVGIFLILARRHKRDIPIPFGPYLAGAGLLALLMPGLLGGLFRLG